MSASDVPASRFRDDPEREIRIGGVIAFAFFGLFLGWAAFAPLDAGAVAHGVVTVAGNRQAVQHRDGGVVSALNVQDGDRVRAGQVLIELASGELKSNERSLTARVLALQATRARLLAEQRGLASVPVPVEFAHLAPDDQLLADQAMALEQQQLAARRSVLSSQQSVLNQRISQLGQEIEGYGRQRTANLEQQRLIKEELTGTKALAEKGYAPQTRVRALERSEAALSGDAGALQSSAARANDQIGEARLQMTANLKQHQEEVVEQLRQTEALIAEAAPRLSSARAQLARAQVRAPAAGKVVDLKVFTVGGVVAPGEKLMEIVPEQASLVIEASVPPDSADELRVGQAAQVRFPTFHERDLPVLTGKVTKVSADSFVDEKTGVRFYRTEIAVPASELAAIGKRRGADAGVKPGLPVEAVIPLRKRTALQYLLEPLGQGIWRSFREQ